MPSSLAADLSDQFEAENIRTIHLEPLVHLFPQKRRQPPELRPDVQPAVGNVALARHSLAQRHLPLGLLAWPHVPSIFVAECGRKAADTARCETRDGTQPRWPARGGRRGERAVCDELLPVLGAAAGHTKEATSSRTPPLVRTDAGAEVAHRRNLGIRGGDDEDGPAPLAL